MKLVRIPLVSSDWSVSDTHVTLSSGHDLALPAVSGLLPQNVGVAMEALYQSGLMTVDQLLMRPPPFSARLS